MSGSNPPTRAFLALFGLVPLVVDIVVVIVAGALQPEYSHVRDFLSELGESGRPYSGAVSLWWGALTFLYLPFVLALRNSLPEQRQRTLVVVTLLVYSITTGFGSWLFPCDPGCKGETTSAQMHFALNYLGMLAMVLAPLFLCLLLRRTSRSGFARFSVLMHFVLLVTLTSMACTFYGVEPLASALRNAQGLLQRVFVVGFYCWSGAVALAVCRARQFH